MKLAYSTNAYRKYALDDAIARIADIGFAGVEIMADDPHVWPLEVSDARIDSIRRAIENAGVEISNVNAFMMTAIQDFWHPSWIEPDPTRRRQRIDHTKASLTFARRIGATRITTEPGGPLPQGITFDQAMDRFVEGLSEALRHAEEVGVQLLVEPEPDLLIENAEQFLELAKRIDSPMFGLNFDIGHFYCVNEHLPEAIARLAHCTKHYHIEDIAATRIHEHLIPGHGAIDFAGVFDAIARTGYDGWITVELYPYLDDPDAAGLEAKQYLIRLIP